MPERNAYSHRPFADGISQQASVEALEQPTERAAGRIPQLLEG